MFRTITFLLVSSLIALSIASENPPQSVIKEDGARINSPIRDALFDSVIIPDVLDDFTPIFSLDLSYPKAHKPVSLGNRLTPHAVRHQPIYEFHPLTTTTITINPLTTTTLPSPSPSSPSLPKNKTYTLLLTDPDAKSRIHPIWSEMCHWIVTNITNPANIIPKPPSPSPSPAPALLESYLPPTPPPGTGYHRYVFVLLEGDAATAGNVSAPRERKHWGYGEVRRGVRDWAGEFGLKVVGANFFYARGKK
ncbi:hypothetical protein AJ79_03859 [Helicocarpus griseus UAMH5409]|uniref:YbhB/YbcL family Raf kinase inhibitor-like protein n=1 Tax=Helicocarpus griseus UAMH5409 TaxID=1447875 RepID=A0A2B7XWZ1_9EURO|nr:hypothetical protein AJ79_03859 [Helicocarpus griseus UAMH5409]